MAKSVHLLQNEGYLEVPGEEITRFQFLPPQGKFSATGMRRIPSQGAALAVAAKVRDIMKVRHMLAHSSEEITWQTTEAMGIATTGQWGPCEACLQVKAKQHAVPKMTDKRANVKGKRLFDDVSGPMKYSSLGGNNYAVIFVDNCTRFEVVKFVKKKSVTTVALLSFIAEYITPQELSLKCIWTDNRGDFEGEFQRKLDRRSIKHAHSPPDTAQYNGVGVAERALGVLREKAITLMQELHDVINVPREILWTQAMLFA